MAAFFIFTKKDKLDNIINNQLGYNNFTLSNFLKYKV